MNISERDANEYWVTAERWDSPISCVGVDEHARPWLGPATPGEEVSGNEEYQQKFLESFGLQDGGHVSRGFSVAAQSFRCYLKNSAFSAE